MLTHATLIARARWRRYGGARLSARIRQRPRSRRRARLLLGAVVILALFAIAPVALAADGTTTTANPWLSPFAIKDSSGYSVDQYGLSLGGEEGFTLKAIADAVGYILAGLLWDIYRLFVAIGLWLIDWSLRFQVIDIFAGVATKLAAALSSTIAQVGVVGAMMAAAAVYFILSVNRGQLARGLTAFLTSFVMAALVQHPGMSLVDPLSGPQGALTQSRDLGMAMAVDITTAGQVTGQKNEDVLRQQTVAKIADVVMRTPHQLINYGAVVDDKCVKTYDEVLKAGAGLEDARTKMAGCDEKYKAASETPLQAATGIFLIGPGGGIILVIGLILAIGLTLVVVLALVEAAGLIWQLLKAILPGDSRSHVFESLAIVGVCLVTIVATIFMLGLLVVTIDAVFADKSTNPIIGFVLLDITLLIAGGYLFMALFKARKRGQKIGRKIAENFSTPSGSSERVAPLQRAAQMATGAAANAVATRGGVGAAVAKAAGAGAGAAAGVQAGEAAAGSAPGRAEMLRQRVGQGVRLSGQVAGVALKSTVGAPVYVPRAVGQAKNMAEARKEALKSKLAAAAARAGEKKDQVQGFTREYRENVVAGVEWTRKVSSSAAERLAGRGPAYGPMTDSGSASMRQPSTSMPNSAPTAPEAPTPAGSAGSAATTARTQHRTPRPEQAPARQQRRGPVTVESMTREAGLNPAGSPVQSNDSAAAKLRARLAGAGASKGSS